MIGFIIWFARGENFKVSGTFDSFSLIIDLGILTFGVDVEYNMEHQPLCHRFVSAAALFDLCNTENTSP